MREILFRGKRVGNGEWVYGSLITYADGVCFICCEDYIPDVLNKYEVIPETVGQYVGLKDKNGNLIFEGDLLRGLFKFGLPITNIYVKFENGAFCTVEKRKESEILYQPLANYFNVDFEIIGNIYDNPELLEV